MVLKQSGIPADHLYWLAETKQEGIYAESRRDEIIRLFEALASRMRANDVFQLFLIGHGSYDGFDYRFNIPGPDLTAAQLGELLGHIPCERQLVVNMTSASGGSLSALRRKGRAVITSTSAGQERNFSVFARYFVSALQDSGADMDKNELVSALEGYRYAVREVARYYESQKRLATEHPLLEDLGDSNGVREPSAENGQGLLAAALAVRRWGDDRAELDTSETRELRAKKRSIEENIEHLKYSKASMDTEEYQQQLEKFLLELARVQQSLDRLEGQEPGNAGKP
jgi:hypothetical protein